MIFTLLLAASLAILTLVGGTWTIRRFAGHRSYDLVRSRLGTVAVFCSLLTVYLALISRFGWSAQMVGAVIMVAMLICLSIIDIVCLRLPDFLTVPLLVLGLVLNFFLVTPFVPFGSALLGAAAGYLVPGILGLILVLLGRPPGIGGGDLKLLAAVGGWLGIETVMTVLLLASLLFSAFHLVAGLRRATTRHSQFPFGPWICGICIALMVLGAA